MVKRSFFEGEIAYAKGIAKLELSQKKYYTGKATFNKKEKEYNSGMSQYKASKTQYDTGMAKLKAATADYNEGKIILADDKSQYDATKTQYEQAIIDNENFTVEPYKTLKENILNYEAVMAQINEYENSKSTLDAIAIQLAAAKAKLDPYEAGMTQINEYEISKTALYLAVVQLAEGKIKLNDAASQLLDGKKALDEAKFQLEDGKTKLVEFESGETQINEGYATLAENPNIKIKIDNGMTPLVAAKKVMDEETIRTTNKLMSRFYLYIALIFVAILIIIAAIIIIILTIIPTVNKINGSVILIIVSFIISILANIYGTINAYTEIPLQMISLVLQSLFTLLFIIFILNYKHTIFINPVE